MTDQSALIDAAMASPRPRPAIPALALQLPTFAGTDLPVSRSPVGNDPRSRTPSKTGELALTQGQIAQVSRQLWPPEGTIGADAVAGSARLGNLRRNERGDNPRQWARYLNQSNVEQERENDKLRFELASAIRWIKLREQWWTQGVHKLQTDAGHEVQSLDLLRREGELELAQRLSAMENIAVQTDHLRLLEATKVQEREATLSMLELQASEMFKQGTDLRQFADTKVDALRAELATSVESEANLRNALALGNQRLAEQSPGLQGSLQQAEQTYLSLQS